LAVNRRRDAFCDQAQEQLTQAFAHRLILLTIRDWKNRKVSGEGLVQCDDFNISSPPQKNIRG